MSSDDLQSKALAQTTPSRVVKVYEAKKGITPSWRESRRSSFTSVTIPNFSSTQRRSESAASLTSPHRVELFTPRASVATGNVSGNSPVHEPSKDAAESGFFEGELLLYRNFGVDSSSSPAKSRQMSQIETQSQGDASRPVSRVPSRLAAEHAQAARRRGSAVAVEEPDGSHSLGVATGGREGGSRRASRRGTPQRQRPGTDDVPANQPPIPTFAPGFAAFGASEDSASQFNTFLGVSDPSAGSGGEIPTSTRKRGSFLEAASGVPRPISSSAQRRFDTVTVIDHDQEHKRYMPKDSSSAHEDGQLRGAPLQPSFDDEGECRCSEEEITIHLKNPQLDIDSLNAQDLLVCCTWCGRRPGVFFCLGCHRGLCPSHVRAHMNDNPQQCTLFINMLDITTSFDRIFWCEPCTRFTWKYVDAYEELTNKLVQTRGTYLKEAATDIFMTHYQIADHGENLLFPSESLTVSIATENDGDQGAKTQQQQPSPTTTLPAPLVAPCIAVTADSPRRERPTAGNNIANNNPPTPNLQHSPSMGPQSPSSKSANPVPQLIASVSSMQGWRATQEDAEIVFRFTIPNLLDASNNRSTPESTPKSAAAHGTSVQPPAALMKQPSAGFVSPPPPPLSFTQVPPSPVGDYKSISPCRDVVGFGVFDGHGGDQVAKLVSHNMESAVQAAFLKRLKKEQEIVAKEMREACMANSPTNNEHQQQQLPRKQTSDGGADLTAQSSSADQTAQHRFAKEADRLAFFTDVLNDAFVTLDDTIQNSPEGMDGFYNMVGCTACLVLVTEQDIVCASSGDSRAVLFDLHHHKVVPLSEDHKLVDEAEEQRVRKAGYTITNGRIEGMLAVPRAFGDYDFKMTGGVGPENQAVTVCPDVRIIPRSTLVMDGLSSQQVGLADGENSSFFSNAPSPTSRGSSKPCPEDWFIAIACDGIWDVLTNDDVCTDILDTWTKETTRASSNRSTDHSEAGSPTLDMVRRRRSRGASMRSGAPPIFGGQALATVGTQSPIHSPHAGMSPCSPPFGGVGPLHANVLNDCLAKCICSVMKRCVADEATDGDGMDNMSLIVAKLHPAL